MGSVEGGGKAVHKKPEGPEEDNMGVGTSILLGTSSTYSIVAHFTVFQGGEREL